MKRLFSLTLVLCLLLAGCGGGQTETEPATTTAAPATEPVTTTAAPATEAATEPPVVYTNPLTGEPMDAPLENRIFGITINNSKDAIPHYGVNDADLYFEMFVNDYSTRGFALYSDVSDVASVGSVRSLRMNFTDICQAYDAIAIHASGYKTVLKDADDSNIDRISVEMQPETFSYRDEERRNDGYSKEHCLFVRASEMPAWAAENGYRITQDANKDYGLHFTENAAPANGEAAAVVTIDMKYRHYITKTNILTYNAETGKYQYHQYGEDMLDGITGEPEAFKNVIVMLCDVNNVDVYHHATLEGSGEGYFACDGKIIPILWSRNAETEPFTYTLTDGTPLEMGIGNSYICITPLESEISWE